MNTTYSLVWNDASARYVPAPETARSRSKPGRSLRRAVVASALLAASVVQAGPSGGVVTQGSATISQTGAPGSSVTTIQQSSASASLNWNSFNVGAQEKVNFIQPTATAVAVNRIVGNSGSTILGQINANGQVYLINPNGIVFGQSAQVNVGALVASTLDYVGSSGGTARFAGTSTATVSNAGDLRAAAGGSIVLLGNTVSNTGTLSTPGGTVALGAGSDISLSLSGNRLLSLKINANAFQALADNGGIIQAEGGQVLISAGAKDALVASVVNNTGIIQAQAVRNAGGRIELLAGMAAGTVNVGGTIDASGAAVGTGSASNTGSTGSTGGFVETSAGHVKVADSARVTTRGSGGQASGTWLIDPNDFTIAASGGNMTGSAVSTALASNNVQISTAMQGTLGGNGDIFVNDAVTWSANKLTLTAERHISINAPLNGGGAGSLALEYGQGAVATGNTADYQINGAPVSLASGQNFSTKLGSNGTVKTYTVVNNATDLQAMNGNLSGNYALGGDIDATGLAWTPVGGNSYGSYAGTFAGLGHTVSNVTVTGKATGGLFGRIETIAQLRDVGVVNVTVEGGKSARVGGLVGDNRGTISNSYSTGSVKGGDSASIGGLVGENWGGTISNSYSTGSVTGGDNTSVGGLVGNKWGGTISNSYSTSSVTGGDGDVYIGGLVSYDNSGSISNSYSTGSVKGGFSATVGGLVSYSVSGRITNSYWNKDTSGQATSSGNGTGLTTAQMQQGSSFAGWDFTNTWAVGTGTNPLLQSFFTLTPVTVTVTTPSATQTKVYDGNAFAVASGNVSISVPGAVSGTLVYTTDANNTTLVNATGGGIGGAAQTSVTSYGVTGLTGNFTSQQNGYRIVYQGTGAGTALQVTPAPLGISFDGTYNGTSSVNSGTRAFVLTGLVTPTGGAQETTQLGSIVLHSPHVSSSNYVTSITSAGGSAHLSNYALSAGRYNTVGTSTTNTATLKPVVITVTPTSASGTRTKTYDGTAFSTAYTESLSSSVATNPTLTGTLVYMDSNGSPIVNATTGTVTSTGVRGLGLASSTSYTFADFTFNYIGGAGVGLNITPATLTAVRGSMTYNGTTTLTAGNGSAGTPALTLTGVTVNGVAETATLSSGSTATLAGKDVVAGGQAVTAIASSATASASSSLLLRNYDLSSVANLTGSSNSVTVIPASLTITADMANKIYGETLALTGFKPNGLQNGETIGSVSMSSAGAAASAGVASYDIVASAATGGTFNAGNYAVSYVNGRLTITPRPVTVSADNKTKVYGDANPALTYKVAANGVGNSMGLVNGDTLAGALSTSATQYSNVSSASNSYTIDASALSNGNYTVTANNGVLTITPRQVTVTADSQTKVYGDANPALTYTVAANGVGTSMGLVNNDSLGALSTTARQYSNVSSASNIYTIDASALSNSNYTVTATNGILTITPRPVTVTADNQTKVYGDANPALTYTVGATNLANSTGLVNGDTLSGGLTTDASQYSNVSSAGNRYTIDASALSNSNYTVTANNGVLTITPRQVSVSADNKTKVYGDTNPALTYTVAANGVGTSMGLVNNDSLGALSTTATQYSNVSSAGNSYTIDASALSNSNYTVTATNGVLTITPRPVSVSADNKTKVYGTANPALTYTVAATDLANSTGLVNNDQLTGALGTTATQTSNVSSASNTYTIDASAFNNATNSNYTVTTANGVLTITPAPLTIAANSTSKTYGQSLSLSTSAFTPNGLQNGETIGSVSMSSAGAAASAGVASYDIVASAAAGGTFNAGNYSISYVNGRLTVTPAALTITAGNASKIYGQTSSLTAFTTSGLQNGESVGSVSLGSTGAAAGAGVGSYAIAAGAASGGTFNAGNYTISYADGSLTVTPRPVTVTADKQTKVYGDANPTLSYTVAPNGVGSSMGLVNGDTLAGALSTTATQTSNVSSASNSYTIDASAFNNATNSNYTVTTANGVLTITPRPVSVSANNQSKVYGDANPALSYTVGATNLANSTGLVNGDTLSGALTTDATQTSNVSSASNRYTIDASALQNGNYTVSVTNGVLTITPKALAVTGTTVAAKTYDGTTLALLTGATLVGGQLVGTDQVNLTDADQGTFASSQPGNDIAVSTSMGLSGAQAGNYTVVQPQGLVGRIASPDYNQSLNNVKLAQLSTIQLGAAGGTRSLASAAAVGTRSFELSDVGPEDSNSADADIDKANAAGYVPVEEEARLRRSQGLPLRVINGGMRLPQ